MNFLDRIKYIKDKPCTIATSNNTHKADMLNHTMEKLVGTTATVTNVDEDGFIELDFKWWWHPKDLIFEKEPRVVKISSDRNICYNISMLDI